MMTQWLDSSQHKVGLPVDSLVQQLSMAVNAQRSSRCTRFVFVPLDRLACKVSRGVCRALGLRTLPTGMDMCSLHEQILSLRNQRNRRDCCRAHVTSMVRDAPTYTRVLIARSTKRSATTVSCYNSFGELPLFRHLAVHLSGGCLAPRQRFVVLNQLRPGPGRLVFRLAWDMPDAYDIVHINDIAAPESIAYLLKYDSIHGTWKAGVKYADGFITVTEGGRCVKIACSREHDPSKVGVPEEHRSLAACLAFTGCFACAVMHD